MVRATSDLAARFTGAKPAEKGGVY
jgi:hypothetical protein